MKKWITMIIIGIGGIIATILIWWGSEGLYRILFNVDSDQISFRIVDSDYDYLRPQIVKATDFIYSSSNNATYTIGIGPSAELRFAQNERNYLFDGGYVLIIINDMIRCEITELVLKSWRDEPGNSKYLLEEQIANDIKIMVFNNQEIVVKTIIDCIGYENN